MRKIDKEVIRQNLIQKRSQYKFTQKEVADKLGISRQQFNKYESRPEMIKVEILFKLAKIYECKIGDFFQKEKAE